ncbi:Ionotropic receptor 244 [Frankliniella occidentalis]|nr:Ionotropic receptor 244 [Frankliniella occidentalis]
MTREETIFCVICLCLVAFREASCDAITLLASRVVRDPEVPCALTLLPPLFQRVDNDSAAYAPRLFVFGNADWLDEFLRRLPSDASIYVFSRVQESKEKLLFDDFFMAEMLPSSSVALFAMNPGQSQPIPQIPYRVRKVYWSSWDSNTEADDAMSNVTGFKLTDGFCPSFIRVMITARPRGTTHVFELSLSCELVYSRPQASAKLRGLWSPAAGWSASKELLFPPLCGSWRPPPDGEHLQAVIFRLSLPNGTVIEDDHPRTDEGNVLKMLKEYHGLVFETTFKSISDPGIPFRLADECRLDVLARPFPGHVLEAVEHTELSVFPWDFESVLLVVPTASGKPRSVLYPITAEYTPAVWAALGAVVLVVVSCLYLMRHDESVQELILQTLSPLLGQPLDDRRTGPQIAVLGGWLLTCTVVVAAYQGQLLGFITVPLENREIYSWQDWLESDLVLLAPNNFNVPLVNDVLGSSGLTEDRVVRNNTASLVQSLRSIAAQRKESRFLTQWEYYMVLYLTGEELRGKLHTFTVASGMLSRSTFFTTKGSPFEVVIRKFFGRVRAAGLIRGSKQQQATEDKKIPITLLNIKPIILIYIIGNFIALCCLILESLLRKAVCKPAKLKCSL